MIDETDAAIVDALGWVLDLCVASCPFLGGGNGFMRRMETDMEKEGPVLVVLEESQRLVHDEGRTVAREFANRFAVAIEVDRVLMARRGVILRGEPELKPMIARSR